MRRSWSYFPSDILDYRENQRIRRLRQRLIKAMRHNGPGVDTPGTRLMRRRYKQQAEQVIGALRDSTKETNARYGLSLVQAEILRRAGWINQFHDHIAETWEYAYQQGLEEAFEHTLGRFNRQALNQLAEDYLDGPDLISFYQLDFIEAHCYAYTLLLESDQDPEQILSQFGVEWIS